MSELKLQAEELEEMRALSRESKTMSFPGQAASFVDPSIPVEDQLWVDKYAPKNFLDLLSDDKTNRSILSWLKEWDPYVFKVNLVFEYSNVSRKLLLRLHRPNIILLARKWRKENQNRAPADLTKKFCCYGVLQVPPLLPIQGPS